MKKIFKRVVLIIGVCLVAYVAYLIVVVGFYSVTHPTISLKPLDKAIDYDIVSAKQIEILLNDEIRQIEKLNKYDLTIGKINMKLDREHRGKISVTFVEKDNRISPKIIIAELDTRERMLYTIQDWGRENKLNPGIIHLHDWKIDSIDAVRIAEEFFIANEDFRYDEIWLHSYDNFLNSWCRWWVFLTDKKNKVRYEISIDPYTGEVSSNNIRFL